MKQDLDRVYTTLKLVIFDTEKSVRSLVTNLEQKLSQHCENNNLLVEIKTYTEQAMHMMG